MEPRIPELGRFAEPALVILVSLSDGPKHGYAIKQAVEQRTDGEIRLGPGTLYEAIQRLEETGLIAEARGGAPAHGQEAQRRYYTLTDRGLETLGREVRQLGRLVDRARENPRLRKGLA